MNNSDPLNGTGRAANLLEYMRMRRNGQEPQELIGDAFRENQAAYATQLREQTANAAARQQQADQRIQAVVAQMATLNVTQPETVANLQARVSELRETQQGLQERLAETQDKLRKNQEQVAQLTQSFENLQNTLKSASLPHPAEGHLLMAGNFGARMVSHVTQQGN